MTRQLLDILFRSPLRLRLAAGALVLGLVVLGWSRTQGPTPAIPATAATVSGDATASDAARTAPSAAGPTPAAVTADPDSRRAAELFLDAWLAASTQPASEWHQRMTLLATPELAAALSLTDPAHVPQAQLAEPVDVEAAGEHAAEFTAELTNGDAVRVQVVSDGRHWAVSDLRPAA